MPVILDPNVGITSSTGTTPSKDLHYNYPLDGDGKRMDLRPGSTLHERIVREVTSRARESYAAISPRHKAWREIDAQMTAYITPSEKERLRQRKDPNKPVSIVIPFMYGIWQALSSQVFSVLSAEPEIHKFTPVGPEDTIGVALLEKNVARQSTYFHEVEALMIQFRDMLCYGFGAVSPIFTRETTVDFSDKPMMVTDPMTGEDVPDPSGATMPVEEEKLLFEGNRVYNIDPYRYLPDPNVPIHKPQDGEFVGWVRTENEVGLLANEDNADFGFFNAGYLEGKKNAISTVAGSGNNDGGGTRINNRRSGVKGGEAGLHPIDVIYMYIKIIPSRWGLGKSKRPEKWMFAVAADKVVIAAKPMRLKHNRFPVAVAACDTDGYASTPMGRLEYTMGMQKSANFNWNMYELATQNNIHGRSLVDQQRVNLNDALNSGPGGVIRVNRLAYGMKVGDVFQPLPVAPPNPNAIANILNLQNWMQTATGATDTLMGTMREMGDRRSATEARGVRSSSLNRIDQLYGRFAGQSMHDLGLMMAMQTQQFMSASTFSKITGRYEEELLAEYGYQQQIGTPGYPPPPPLPPQPAPTSPADGSGGAPQAPPPPSPFGPPAPAAAPAAVTVADPSAVPQQAVAPPMAPVGPPQRPVAGPPMMPVGPQDIDVPFDLEPFDGTARGEEFFDSWIQLYQMVISNPILIQQMDVFRLFKHIARLGGAKNVSDFVNKGGLIAPQMMGGQQVAAGVASGGLQPVGMQFDARTLPGNQ